MGKQKTKRIPFDNTATEVEPGVWQWTLSGKVFQFRNVYGLNTGHVTDGTFVGLVQTGTINEAACYIEGLMCSVSQ